MARPISLSLLLSWTGTHAADQLAFAALPLTAVLALGAGPDLVGQLLAAQGAAWLLVSLPAGALADRLSRRSLLVLAAGTASLALAAATISAIFGSAFLLGLSAFAAASGTVVFVLATSPLVATMTAPRDLPRANAALEFARALVTLAAPPLVGALATHVAPTAGYALGTAAAVLAFIAAIGLPRDSRDADRPRRAMLQEIRDGATFVLGHPLLGAIGLCAVFWNFAFFALLTVFVPFALGILHFDAAEVGIVQAAYGAGLILGAMAAPAVTRAVRPGAVLVFGPGSSAIAPVLVLAAMTVPHGSAVGLAVTGYFLIGFGPMLWLVCQTSLRQIVTPSALLGRVGATIQVAIYGVRPLGALAAGWIASTQGYPAALALAASCFAISVLVVAVSPLARLRAMPEPDGLPQPAR